MTINGGTAWAAFIQSYGKGSSGVSQTASADYTSMLPQATDMLMSSLDRDKSGTIDKAEFSQAVQALSEKTAKTYNDASSVFGSIDSNNDSAISVDELMRALQQSQGKHAHDGHHRPKPEALDTTAQSATTDTTQSASKESLFSTMQTVPEQKATEEYSSNASIRSRNASSIFTVIYRIQEHMKAYSDASSKLESLIKAYDTNPQSLSKANTEVYTCSQALHEDTQALIKAADDLRMYLHPLRSNTKHS